MAITYHSGRRIQGLEYTASNITKDEDFSDVWNGVGSNISITGGELVASSVDASGDNRLYRPLGFTLGSNFTARWEHTPKGVSNNNVFFIIMVFSAGNSNLSTGTNMDSIRIFTDNSSQALMFRGQDGTTAGTNSGSQALTTDTKYYLELVKNGTSGTLYVRTGSHSGTLVNTLTATIASGITGLTHVQSGAMTGGNAGTGGYIVDNLEIWNNATSASGTATFTENFSSSDIWTQSPSDSQFAVSSSDGRLNFLDDVNSTGDRTWYDLGTDVSTTQWVLRFKFRFTTLSNGSIQYYEFDAGLSDTTVNNNTNQNFIGVRVLPNDDIDLWRPRVCDGSSSPRSGATADLTQVFATNTDYFAEIKRTSASNWAISLSTTNAYDGDLQNNSYTDASGATGLRYLKIGDAVTNTGTGFSMEGYVDDVEFYNDTTTPIKTAIGDEKPTNVQVGSRFEETDTRKMYNAQDITGSDVSLTGLKAYYKFDESSGNLINQSTTGDGLGSNADGTASGDPTYSVTGKINKAISFDGDGDKFTLGTTAGQWNFLHNNSNFSVSFWLKLNATPSENQGILGTGTGGSSIGFDLTVNHSTGGKLRASIENGAGASANIQSSAGFVPQNTTTWYHYVLTFSNGSWNIYRNGGNNESASSSVSWSTSNHSRNMELANANANTPTDVKDLTGELDEVSIWSRVLTSAEISSLYQDIYNIIDGSIFYTTDTNKEYVLYNNTWTEV